MAPTLGSVPQPSNLTAKVLPHLKRPLGCALAERNSQKCKQTGDSRFSVVGRDSLSWRERSIACNGDALARITKPDIRLTNRKP